MNERLPMRVGSRSSSRRAVPRRPAARRRPRSSRRPGSSSSGTMPSAVEISAWRPTWTPKKRSHSGANTDAYTPCNSLQTAIQGPAHRTLAPVTKRVDGGQAGGLPRQQPAQTSGHQHGHAQKQRAGGDGQQEEEAEGYRRADAGIKHVQGICVQPVNQHERRERGQKKQHRHPMAVTANKAAQQPAAERGKPADAAAGFAAVRSERCAGAPSQISSAGIFRQSPAPIGRTAVPVRPVPCGLRARNTAFTTESRLSRTGPRTSSPPSTRAFSMFTNVPMLAPSSTVRSSGASQRDHVDGHVATDAGAQSAQI